MLYAYIKKRNKQSIISRLPSPKAYKSRLPRRVLAVSSAAFLLAGLFLIGQVVYPIVGWYLFVLPSYSSGIVSPLASNFHPESSPLYPALVQAQESIAPTSREDSFKVSTWFVGVPQQESMGKSNLRTYTISIPKLKIDMATVEVGGEDLKKSLVAWPTSAPPGTYGNNIIFGHSELPQFASPGNYSGIFTHIMELEKGDEIYVDYDGVRYKYLVAEKNVVDPTNLSVLEQRFDSSYITLITCVPPGTVWQRGIVKGILTQY